jgi:hypothetical protein
MNSTSEPATATTVVFRKWKDSGDIFALFPELPSDALGYHCDSYEHIGQHGRADYHGCIKNSTPAQPEEYQQLLQELTRIGYQLTPITRATAHHHDKRQEEARQYRNKLIK